MRPTSTRARRATRLLLVAVIAIGGWEVARAERGPAAEAPGAHPPPSTLSDLMNTAVALDDDIVAVPTGSERWRVEVEREESNRGMASESTKTTIKIERYGRGPVSRLRLELPFPDLKTDGTGSSFNPRLGDVKARMDLAGFIVHGLRLSPLLELTFPTADPPSLGSGKYQVGPGIETVIPLVGADGVLGPHLWSGGVLVQQVVSVAGDESAKDINYTKFEIALLDEWERKASLKLTFKPVINWMQNYGTGAVLELEGGVRPIRDWKISLMIGHLLWGAGMPCTYERRIQVTLGHEF